MRALVVSTVAKSLAFQAPSMWPILRERGYDLTFAAAADQHVDLLETQGVFRALTLDRGLTPRNLAGMRQLRALAGQDWDLVQLQTPVASSLLRAMGRPGRLTPSLYVAHGLHATRDLPRRSSAVYQGVEHALAGRTTALAVVCGEDFELARRLGWGRRTLVWRLPGAGVRTGDFAVDPAGQERSIALYVGELNANKRIGHAVAVGERLVREGLVQRLVVIGDGPLRSAVQPGVEAGWLEHHPYCPDVHPYYREAAVLLHPSVREGLPRVIIEAQAAGVPVLARSNRGSRELVVEGTGTVLPTDASVAEWVAAYRAMAPQHERMVANSRQYDVEAFDRSYRSLISEVAGRAAPGYVDMSDQR